MCTFMTMLKKPYNSWDSYKVYIIILFIYAYLYSVYTIQYTIGILRTYFYRLAFLIFIIFINSRSNADTASEKTDLDPTFYLNIITQFV